MNKLLYFYQHIPLGLNPTAIRFGFFSISYYSLMYIMGFATVYFLLRYRIKKIESDVLNNRSLADFLLYSFIGLLVGARLGHVFFYNFEYFLKNPVAVISPFDPVTHEFIGIYGMSYFGGLIGVLPATLLFVKKNKINFWKLTDFVVPAIPAGYFFGRIGNFINNELYGKITDRPWGMYFKDYPWQLRQPSQLYEAFSEGIILFMILWTIRNRKMCQGNLLSFYLIGYGIFRFIWEYFREPDQPAIYLLGYFTLGQIFSLAIVVFAMAVIIFQKQKKLV
jgi:phosphatidylglycerol---prolipoprotein diacylglyceryl transferase